VRPESWRIGQELLRDVLLVDRAHGVDLEKDPDAGLERFEERMPEPLAASRACGTAR
jgi:hypothetical protein